jgi:hypothetical protein
MDQAAGEAVVAEATQQAQATPAAAAGEAAAPGAAPQALSIPATAAAAGEAEVAAQPALATAAAAAAAAAAAGRMSFQGVVGPGMGVSYLMVQSSCPPQTLGADSSCI